jgi:hypothetical protein
MLQQQQHQQQHQHQHQLNLQHNLKHQSLSQHNANMRQWHHQLPCQLHFTLFKGASNLHLCMLLLHFILSKGA